MFRKRARKFLSCKGFTLLEIMVALAILSGVVITILTSLNYHLKAVDRIKAITTATLLAKEKVEEISLQGIPKVVEGDLSGGFQWRLSTEDTILPGVKKIYLTVSWGKDGKVLIETYKFGK